ncbi:DUF4952 domain-containing protein [Metapseudomonas otitidis]|uniref:DUF4952 domain-containing protein n=1 Tax=Metapseudomonas otitidis TaxID=319939 RepID=UPI003EDFBC5E
MRRGVLLAVALLPLLAWGEEPGCGDYLATLGVSAPGLQFDGCRLEEGGQLRQRVAEYSIPGRDARALEARLEQRFGLQPLRFVCCGWEAPSVYAPHPAGRPYGYEIGMGSGETLEKDWTRIDRFHVRVTLFLEEP